MTEKKRGLGRGLNDLGLDELLSKINVPVDAAPAPTATPAPTKATQTDSNYKHLPVDLLQPGQYQPRKDFDQEALQELANSIQQQGIIQPLAVRTIAEGKYEIIAGERRWRAAQLAGLLEVPVIEHKLSDEQTVAVALIENIQREDLNVIEEAVALQRLIHEFDLTHEEVAKQVGKSRATITNTLRLLTLNEDVRTMLERGDLDMGHARALLGLAPEQQSQSARAVVARGLSVRETERFIQSIKKPNKVKAPKTIDPDIQRLQSELSDKLGTSVVVQHGSKGSGKLVIHYHSLETLDGILDRIK